MGDEVEEGCCEEREAELRFGKDAEKWEMGDELRRGR